MALKELVFIVPLKLRSQSFIGTRHYFKNSNKILETAEEKPVYLEEPEDTVELEKKRNKSRLTSAHRNILFGRKPYEESMAWYHDTIRYKKRMLGRYGIQALDVPAGISWPTLQEVEDMKEYERIAFPLSMQDRLQKIKEERNMAEEALIARQKAIDAKMVNMQKFIADVQIKIAEKQAAEEEAKLKKEHKIERIRQQLIAEGSMSKEKLEQALTMSEKAEKKKEKEAKKAKQLAKQIRFLKDMAEKEATEHVDVAVGKDIEENKKQ